MSRAALALAAVLVAAVPVSAALADDGGGGSATVTVPVTPPTNPGPGPAPKPNPRPPIVVKPKTLATKPAQPPGSDPAGTVASAFTAPGPGTATGQSTTTVPATHAAKKSKTVVFGRAHKLIKQRGKVTLVIKPTAAGAKLLRAHRTLKLTVTITFQPKAGGVPSVSTTKRTVRYKRPSGRRGR